MPPSVTNCTSLTKLMVCANKVADIPVAIGQLVNLKSLWCTENLVTDIPKELELCAGLEELRLGINPLEQKWKDILCKGVDHVLWECRQMELAHKRGPPPKMTYNLMGINQEAMVAHAEAKVWHQNAIDIAGEGLWLCLCCKGG